MKKIIEADLVSLAHRILQMKEKYDTDNLLEITEKLYHKLILLKFYEDNKFRLETQFHVENLINIYDKKETTAPDIPAHQSSEILPEKQKEIHFSSDYMTHDIINDLVEDSKNDHFTDVEEEKKESNQEFTPTVQETVKSVEEVREEIKQIEETTPIEGSNKDEEKAILDIDPVYEQIFHYYPTENKQDKDTVETPERPQVENQHFVANNQQDTVAFHQAPINRTINDAFSSTIVIGLNDRIGFEKQLFAGSAEDLNRVISQLNTCQTYQEAVDFIEDLVKPDFEYWKGKEEYEERFMELVKKRFL